LTILGATILGPAAGSPERRDQLVLVTETVLEHVMARSRSLGFVPGFLPTRSNVRYVTALDTLDRAIHDAVHDARNGRGTGPLLDMVVEGGPHAIELTNAQLRNEVVTFFIAGHETVASALTWTWYLLAKNPAVAERVRREATATLAARALERVDRGPARASACPVKMAPVGPIRDARERCFDTSPPYEHAVFQEALRLYPPAWVATRRAKVDDEISGVPIPRGSLVIASPFATHRLADVWENPDEFDPERFRAANGARQDPFAYFPFGGGPHLCIGSHFALIEGAAALEVLASQFQLELVDEDPVLEAGVTLRPRGGLRMRPVPLDQPAHRPAAHCAASIPT
jgi:cytochrome P450